MLLKMDTNDEFTSIALGYRQGERAEDGEKYNPDIKIRYSNDQLLRIYKNLGKFEHPLSNVRSYGVDEHDSERLYLLDMITLNKPDLMPELLKDDIDLRRQRA